MEVKKIEQARKASQRIIATILMVPLLLIGCVAQDTSSGRRGVASVTGNSSATPTPAFNSSFNYLQNGSVTSQGSMVLNGAFSDAIYLRGKEIHNYISSNGNTAQNNCLLNYFSSIGKVLVIAAIPRYIYNFSTGVREYYYWLSFGDEAANKSTCQTANLLVQMQSRFPSASLHFSMGSLVSGVATGQIQGAGMELLSKAGLIISGPTTNNLKLLIQQNYNTPPPGSTGCTGNSQCVALGYDCCSSNICVNQGQIRADADLTSSEWPQAQKDVIANPSNIHLYPQFYYVCSNIQGPTPTPTAVPNAQEEAYQRFLEKEELYKCITPSDGEAATCVQTSRNISNTTLPATYTTTSDDLTFSTVYSGTMARPVNNISKITYADTILFQDDTIQVAGSVSLGPSNDALGVNDKQMAVLNSLASTNLLRDYLKIYYQIDASCIQVNSTLAKCYKTYIQGKNSGSVTDHFPASNLFKLPYYADTSRRLQVEVDNNLWSEGRQWQLNSTGPSIEMLKDGSTSFSLLVLN
ncbi:MAG: hypothetical protein WCG27_11280, partial [Pseudomonadota bacterium]